MTSITGKCETECPSINEVFSISNLLFFGGFLCALFMTEHINHKRRILRASLSGLGFGFQ